MSNALLGQGSHASILDYNVDAITTSQISVWDVIDIFIKTYGSIVIYLLISLLFLLYIFYQFYQNRKISEDDFIYSFQFCVAVVIGIALLTGYFVIFEPLRAAMYGLILATILCGLFFFRLWSSVSKKRQQGLSISITLVMTIVCMLAMLAIYQSPWISTSNMALPYEDKNGIDWILDYRSAEIPVIREEGTMSKYKNYYYESENIKNDEKFIELRDIPSNFGYMTNRTIGDSFAFLRYKNVYLVTTEKMKLAPYAVSPERRSRSKWYRDPDFIRLQMDPSVNRIYSSNEFGVWNIHIR